jgi:hypothetical protein
MRISAALGTTRAVVRRARSLAPDWVFAAAVTGAFLLVGAVTASRHEMWRDEIQAWLLARDSTGPIDLFRHLKYEGHPGLWHLGLMPLTRITWNPVIMQVFHLLIATASVYVFCAKAPFTRLQKALFAFGYFTLYEYSILCRNYGVGMLLLCLFAAMYQARSERPIRPAIALFLLAHTSVHALIVTGALFGGLFLDYAAQSLMDRDNAPLRRARVWASLLIVLAGMATSALQLNPPEDTGFAQGWKTTYVAADAKRATTLVTHAYLPIPEEKRGFWNSHRLGLRDWFAGEFYNDHRFGVALALVAVFAVTLVTRPTAFAAFGVATFGLLAFFYVKYFGAMRHHGFLYLTLVFCLWIARSAWAPRMRAWRVADKWLWRVGGVALTGLLIVQAWGGVTAIRMERDHVFSYAEEAARYIREHDLADHVIIAQQGPAMSTSLGYLRKDRFYYTSGERFGSFIVWDQARLATASDDRVVAAARELADDTLVLRNVAWPEESRKRHGIEELTRFTGATVDEDYYLYRIRTATDGADAPEQVDQADQKEETDSGS